MPYTKNNFLQLQEWCTLKQLNNKGFMPTGEPFKLAPSGYRMVTVDYYSPYEVRVMTDEELEDYNADRKVKIKKPKKPFVTLLYKFQNYYNLITVIDKKLKYKKVIVTQKIMPSSRRSYRGNEVKVIIYDECNDLIFEGNVTTICTRITRGPLPFIYNDYYNDFSAEEDPKLIKSVVNVDDELNREVLIKIKQILANSKLVEATRDNYQYIDFNDFLN